jgi:hypothetical protein
LEDEIYGFDMLNFQCVSNGKNEGIGTKVKIFTVSSRGKERCCCCGSLSEIGGGKIRTQPGTDDLYPRVWGYVF